MIDFYYSEALKELINNLDDEWEKSILEKIPFPIAYIIEKVKKEEYEWEFLLKEPLHIILKYFAILGMSDYFQNSKEPNYEINDELKLFQRNMHEGDWIRIARACAQRKGNTSIPQLAEIYKEIEESKFTVRFSVSRFSIDTNHQGLLSTLLTARNKLFAHGPSLTKEEKMQATPHIIKIIRAILYLGLPLLEKELIQVFPIGGREKYITLLGIKNFQEYKGILPEKGVTCFLSSEDKPILKIFPFVFSDLVKKGQVPSLLDEQAEVYVINSVSRSSGAKFIGINGARHDGGKAGQIVIQKFNEKRVWDTKQDIDIDNVLNYILQKTKNQIQDIEINSLYLPESYVEMDAVSYIFEDFLKDKDSRAIFITGKSGCGKSAAIFHLTNKLIKERKIVILLRAIELPTSVIKGKQFENWLTANIGYYRKFADILKYVSSKDLAQVVIIVDGLNEFTEKGDRDASLLFRALNNFLIFHSEFSCLKMIFTARADMLDIFFPGKKLPEEVEENLYYKSGGKDYFEIGPMTKEQAEKLLSRYGIEENKIQKILDILDDKLFPHLLIKMANIPNLGEENKIVKDKITEIYLENNLKQDKQLKKSVQEITRLMLKLKTLRLDEENIKKNNPKLLDTLLKDNHRLLTKMINLKIVQQINYENEEGKESWALTMTHETIFEVLDKWEKQRSLFYSIISNLSLFILFVIFTFFSKIWIGKIFNSTILELESNIQSEISAINKSDAEYEARQNNLKKLNQAIKKDFNLKNLTLQEYFSKLLIWKVFIPIILISFIFDLLLYWNKIKDRRPANIRFYSNAFSNMMFRKITPPVILMCIISIILTLMILLSFDNIHKPFRIARIILPLIVCIIILIISIPFITIYKVNWAKNGSPLLKKIIFASERIKGARKGFFISALMTTLVIFYFTYFISSFSLINLYSPPKKESNNSQMELENLYNKIDLKLLLKYAPKTSKMSFDRVKIYIENKYNISIFLSNKDFAEFKEERHKIFIFLMIFTALFLIYTYLSYVGITQWGAKKYYKK